MTCGKQAQQMRHQRHIEDGDDAQMEGAARLSRFAVEFLEKILELPKNRTSMFLKN